MIYMYIKVKNIHLFTCTTAAVGIVPVHTSQRSYFLAMPLSPSYQLDEHNQNVAHNQREL